MSPYRYPSCHYVASAHTTLEKLGQLPNLDNIAAQKVPQGPPSSTLHSRKVLGTLAEDTKSALVFKTEIFIPLIKMSLRKANTVVMKTNS